MSIQIIVKKNSCSALNHNERSVYGNGMGDNLEQTLHQWRCSILEEGLEFSGQCVYQLLLELDAANLSKLTLGMNSYTRALKSGLENQRSRSMLRFSQDYSANVS
ncbi:hypothetical protein SLA2020_267220 [Shorea laevis]